MNIKDITAHIAKSVSYDYQKQYNPINVPRMFNDANSKMSSIMGHVALREMNINLCEYMLNQHNRHAYKVEI